MDARAWARHRFPEEENGRSMICDVRMVPRSPIGLPLLPIFSCNATVENQRWWPRPTHWAKCTRNWRAPSCMIRSDTIRRWLLTLTAGLSCTAGSSLCSRQQSVQQAAVGAAVEAAVSSRCSRCSSRQQQQQTAVGTAGSTVVGAASSSRHSRQHSSRCNR